ncbi:similar to Saccharomyces cerevisiae YJL194W CDC6 Essential ATP-binding protein required for DNA replication [Maudiozyma saulgeensis]|uniref:Cell division control protein n=1 Tax=Maudiozyma saulgeensis TaxID=1789683 RepID=A0A1X7R1E7_9SACH|nr:similar to Saccharomyces cerevisiae YJL194W CDC6 Essential ATP-binding protein required for DNA replication [Kazachstania saulgeensis]
MNSLQIDLPPFPETPKKLKRSRDILDSFTNFDEVSPIRDPIKNGKKLLRNFQYPSPENSPEKKKVKINKISSNRLVFGKQSIYARTKSLLQRSSLITPNETGALLTREYQCSTIMNFLDENIINHKSNSLYITGPPGTGKTAQLESLLKNKFLPIDINKSHIKQNYNSDLVNNNYYQPISLKERTQNVNVSSINCIAIKEPSQIFQRIYESFVTKEFESQNKTIKTMLHLQTFLKNYSKETTFVVILDEMDKLVRLTTNDTHATRIIFELFMLARLPDINFILIGIANSLDMKDKFLSRLNLRQDLLPKTVVFNPYSAEEMFQIIMDKINTLDECIFNPMAIKFAAKKCSGNTGDLRKLLDILRHSIEIVELENLMERRKNGQNSIQNNNNDDDSQIKKIGLQHIAKVFSSITNSSSTRSRISKINMQQKVILCSLVQREKTDIFQSSCNLDDAFSYYVKLLNNKDVFKPMNRNEFLEICNALETCGLVEINSGRSTGKTKHIVKLIKTTVDEKEFTQEISKTELLKNFLIL